MFDNCGFPRIKHPSDLKKNESYKKKDCEALTKEGVSGDSLREIDTKFSIHGELTFLSVVKLDDDFLEIEFTF